MILKGFRHLLLPFTTRLLAPCPLAYRVIAPLSSQQQSIGDAKPMQAAAPRKAREERDLTGLLKSYRAKMEGAENKLAELAYHCKKIASHYKKTNHAEFLDQKAQLESLLKTVAEFNYSGLEFTRNCAKIQSTAGCWTSSASAAACKRWRRASWAARMRRYAACWGSSTRK